MSRPNEYYGKMYYGDLLTHYGVPGMKWGKRKARLEKQTLKLQKRNDYNQKKRDTIDKMIFDYNLFINKPNKSPIEAVAASQITKDRSSAILAKKMLEYTSNNRAKKIDRNNSKIAEYESLIKRDIEEAKHSAQQSFEDVDYDYLLSLTDSKIEAMSIMLASKTEDIGFNDELDDVKISDRLSSLSEDDLEFLETLLEEGYDDLSIKHYGILGMKWGKRKNKNSSPSVSSSKDSDNSSDKTKNQNDVKNTKEESKKVTTDKKSIQDYSDQELQQIVNRYRLENELTRYVTPQTNTPQKSAGRKFAEEVLRDAGKKALTSYTSDAMNSILRSAFDPKKPMGKDKDKDKDKDK